MMTFEEWLEKSEYKELLHLGVVWSADVILAAMKAAWDEAAYEAAYEALFEHYIP